MGIPISAAASITMNTRWLRRPTQLSIHGQWWSWRGTHLPQTWQCLERSGRRARQVMQNERPLSMPRDASASTSRLRSSGDAGRGHCPGDVLAHQISEPITIERRTPTSTWRVPNSEVFGATYKTHIVVSHPRVMARSDKKYGEFLTASGLRASSTYSATNRCMLITPRTNAGKAKYQGKSDTA